ncbi:MAG: 3-oxoacyl-[acyl-carrier-protein] synthase-3 [Saprospiraceae bacterium]|jgi:3-oxoacyl-[acyl-carrier-protein] synthase-3
MVYINSISYYFPERIVDNSEIIANYKRVVDEFDEVTSEDIFEQTGVAYRYESDLSDTAKDLGLKAAERLFARSEIDKDSIQALIFVSDAIEYKGPAAACVLQSELELSKAVMAFDILHGCTGWVYGISLAKALIESNQVESVLLVTSDTPRRVIHPEDLELSAIFSDGAAATLLTQRPNAQSLNLTINDFVFGTDGKGREHLYVERSGSKNPADIKWLSQYKHIPSGLRGGRLRMNSNRIFMFVLRKVPQLTSQILKKHDIEIGDIDYFLYHQANGTMLEYLRKRMKIPNRKFIINIRNIGNTVSSTIPIALKELLDENKIPSGSKILVAGFGIGYSWGGTIITT